MKYIVIAIISLLLPLSFAKADTTLVDSQVFNGTCPSTFTDLSLASTTGATTTVSMLKVNYAGGAGGATYTFETKGETTSGNSAGINITSPGSNNTVGYTLVKTNSSGIVQWKCNFPSTSQVNVISYWTQGASSGGGSTGTTTTNSTTTITVDNSDIDAFLGVGMFFLGLILAIILHRKH